MFRDFGTKISELFKDGDVFLCLVSDALGSGGDGGGGGDCSH
jgi:hypothetical protein